MTANTKFSDNPQAVPADSGGTPPSIDALVAFLNRLDEVGIPHAKMAADRLKQGRELTEAERQRKFDEIIKVAGPMLADKALDWIEVVHGSDTKVELVALYTQGEETVPDGQAAGRVGDANDRLSLRQFLLERIGRSNLYVGAQPRDHDFDGTRRGSADDVAEYVHLPLDFDRWEGETSDTAETRLREVIKRLSSFPLTPKALVWSGGGLQAWFGIEPTRDRVEMGARKDTLNKLSKRIGSDPVSDLPRIMRLPFTVNIPSRKKRESGRDVALAVPVSSPNPKATALGMATVEGGFATAFQGIMKKLQAGRTRPANIIAANAKPWPAPLGPAQADRWLKALKNDLDRDEWIGLLHAHRGAGGTREAALEWSGTFEGSDPVEDERVIDTLGASLSGWGTLQAALWKQNPVAAAKMVQADAREAFLTPLEAGELDWIDNYDPDDTEPPWLVPMNKRFALIAGINGVYDSQGNGTDPSPLRIRQVQEFRNFHNGIKKIGNSGLGTAWLSHPDARRYEGVGMWMPGSAPPRHLNLWSGLAVQPMPGTWPVLDEFLREVIADGDGSKYAFLLNWIAQGLQNPLDKMETAIALIGEQGTGKGTLGKMLLELWGPSHSVHVQTAEQLLGRFNAHMEYVVFGFADEATFGKDRALSNHFKALITEPVCMYEAKFQTSRMGPNRTKWVLATNNLDGVPIEIGDRRVSVFELSKDRARDTGHFSKLWDAWNTGEREAFLADMLTRDLSKFDPRSVLAGDVKLEIALATADPVTRWWGEVLDNGVLPRDAFDEGDQAGWEDVGAVVEKSALFAAFEDWARRNRVRHPPTRAEVGKTLGRVCPGVKRQQNRHDGRPRERFLFPPLDQCRRDFITALGGTAPADNEGRAEGG